MVGKKQNKLTSPQFLVTGFLITIGIGTFLLMLPISTTDGTGTALIDALFTATSAVCVTGLTIMDTGTFFSVFGQVVIMFLIEIGGLGFMSMSVLFALALGKKIMFKERLIMQEALNQINVQGIVRITKYLVGFSFALEAIGAIILGFRWMPEIGAGKAFYFGLFHTVSAYCNAGFSLFSDNLANYCGDIAVNLVITSLIIIGGIGITVVIDLRNCLTNRKRKLSLHSKMALLITAVLLIIGTISIFVFEFNNPKSMAGFPLPSKILGAYFQSVTARTAGFNTLPIGAFNQITLFFIMIIMFIGASPGSTGGGIKTTTFGVIMVLVRSIIKGKKEVEVFRRGIPQNTIFKALTILIISLGVVLMGTMILLISEPFSLMEILFEEVSAFGTVGLSTGITPYLSSVGKLVIVSTMFLGRLGPLTLAFALTERLRQKSQVRYPEEKITVG